MPFAFFDECCNLELGHPFGLEILQASELENFPPPIGYGTRTKAMITMTNRFVKISAGSERLEIRRYEDTDKGINLNRIQEYWVGRKDQTAVYSKIDP